VSLISISYLFSFRNDKNNLQQIFPCLLFLSFFLIIIATRNLEHPGDTKTYLQLFSDISEFNNFSYINKFRIELLFLLTLDFFSIFTDSHRVVLFLLSLIFVILWYVLFLLCLKGEKLFICVFIFISLFCSYNLGANIIRQGIALPIVYMSVVFLFKGKNLLSLLLLCIGVLFHKAVILVFISALISKYIKKTTFLHFTFFALSLISLIGIFNAELIKYVINTYTSYSHIVSEYASERYQTGFRASFWLFSFLPVLAFFLVDKTTIGFVESKLYVTYLILACMFVVAFSIPFSDRVGVLSWSIIPVLLGSFHKNYNYKIFNNKIFINFLIFTLGILSFLFYSVLEIGYELSDVI
jgi:hypothetical protein